MYIGRTIKAILDERASSRANGSVSTRHFHRFSFTRLNSIGSSRKSVEPVLTRYLTRSAPVSYKIPYVISARRRRTSSPSDGRCASRGRLSSRKKKKKKKKELVERRVNAFTGRLKAGARPLAVSFPSSQQRWPTTRWTRGGKSSGFRRINLLILGFDCQPNDSRSPRR